MKLYKLIHYLSIDIVLGALASSCLAARLFNSTTGWAWWPTLAISVWILYMGDHILDAWKHRKSSHRELHLFIFRNRKILLWLMGVLTIVDLLLIFNFMDKTFVSYGLALAAVVLLFYAMRHIFRRNRVLFIPGEFFVLVLYMAGTWLGPLVTRSGELITLDGLIAIMFAGVLLMNLGIISLYDIKLDSRLGIASLASTIGKQSTRTLIAVAGILIYLAAIMQFLVFGVALHTQYVLVLSGMATILLLILFLPSYFRQKDIYRMAADAVLYMGFLTLLIHR